MKKLLFLIPLFLSLSVRADWYASQSWVSNYVSTLSGGASISPGQSNVIKNSVTNDAGGNISFNVGTYEPNSNSFTSYGSQTYKNATLRVGADAASVSGLGTITASTPKFFNWVGTAFDSQNYIYGIAFMSLSSPTNGSFQLAIGGNQTIGVAGTSQLFFMTGNGASNNAIVQWTVDGNGNLYPSNSSVTLGTTARPIPSTYSSNVVALVSVTAPSIVSSIITNGSMVLVSATNAAPSANANFVWLAVSTNAPGFIFVGSNSVWVRK
jgi:hypothetical protein